MSGPVSSVIEQEVLGELRRQGIVVWLDKDGAYTHFVDGLAARHAAGDFLFPVVGFRGSFLELLLELEPFGSGIDKTPLLIHMPGFAEESIRKTPVLELYEAGVRFRKGLETLVREAATSRVAPADIEAFVATKPSLEAADAWLSSAVAQNAFGLAAALEAVGPRLVAEALAQPSSTLAGRVTTPEDALALREYLLKLTGMDDAWLAFYGEGKVRTRPLDGVLEALAAWLLAVEYVHDLRRLPHLQALQRLRDVSAPLVKSCSQLLTQLRRDNGDAYAQWANEVEAFLAAELDEMTPDDLGQIDTFREEELRVLTGAVEALRRGDWAKAKSWCDVRRVETSFWLQRDQSHRWAWSLVAEAAAFGEILARHPRPFEGARSLEQAVERYAAGAFEVDRAQRRFEQKRLALLEPRLPHFGPLQEVVGALRREHRAWADTLSAAFAALCQEHGFLPASSMQQRTLYEQAIHPLTLAGEKVAVFLIDALRYEMAAELADELTGAGVTVDLKPRLAELPTITKVGMNALAPVAQGGRLAVAGAFEGFKTGEYTVRTPETRARAMGLRSTGRAALALQLGDVGDENTTRLTARVKPHPLVVVHSREIDDAGEANVGLPTFEATLRQIKAAWHHLQLAGVKHFVFTADHGFLLQDETTRVQPFGTKRTPQRRHVFDPHPRAEAGMVSVSVSSLGYDGVAGYLLLREDTALYDTGVAGASFVHGGNSPQERIIPVLTVTRRRIDSGGIAEYSVEVECEPDVVGLHRLRLRVVFAKGTTTSLGCAASRTVDLALRVPGRDAVRAVLKDATKPAVLKAGRVQVPVGEEWTEVFFGLDGPVDERVRVEVHHPDNVEKVRSARPDQWYAVSGMPTGSAAVPAPAPRPVEWADAIVDEGTRRVFLHIDRHGAITESEVTNMLGSPRAFRRFSLAFDEHLPKLPFRVRIETAEGGKRYVRQEDR